jgi:hypothetical protein
MYLRTTARSNADGSRVRYFQLAENVWDPDKGQAVAKVVHNFGRADAQSEESLRRLAQSILRAVGSAEELRDRDDLTMLDARPIGAVWVLDALWRELGIAETLRELLGGLGARRPYERALFLLVAHRAIAPSSKLDCWRRWRRDGVYLPSADPVRLQDVYRCMDFFTEHKEQIERAVYFKVADLLNVDVDLIFYDTTSLHFEIDDEDEVTQRRTRRDGTEATYEPLRKRGHSKNGRTDAPQIVIGMAVTRDGLPVRSWVFTGNTNDVTTVEKVKEDLKGWKLGRCVFVGDAGMNSESNRRTLALGGGKYILASRMRADGEVSDEVLTRAGRYHVVKDNLRVKEVYVGDGERRQRYVVCHNPSEERRQRVRRAKHLEHLRAELAALSAGAPSSWQSARATDLERSELGRQYLRRLADGRLKVNLGAVKSASRYDGKWVVTTNDDTLSAEDLALGYKQLLRVEEAWRSLKSGLGLRPVYHWRPWRIEAHAGLCVLALLLERVVELRSGQTWRTVRHRLQQVKVVTYEREGVEVRQTTEPDDEAARILRALKVAAPPRYHAITAGKQASAPKEGVPGT